MERPPEDHVEEVERDLQRAAEPRPTEDRDRDRKAGGPGIEEVEVACYKIPTVAPESDGTLEWDHTTVVVVEVAAGGERGIGYSYADRATAVLARDLLGPKLRGRGAFATAGSFVACARAIRNLGRPGVSSMAISAVDAALWDLKAKLLGLSLVDLLGPARDRVPVYGSGGFTSLTVDELQAQLGGWADQGMRRVKMKVGRDPAADVERVRAAREAIGDEVQLFVDANGAYDRALALAQAERFADSDVVWFEEPVSSDDLEGLRLLRDRAPAGMEIAAGEYGYDLPYFRRLLEAGAVGILQADATRCGGPTGLLGAAALCVAHCTPLSAHCAPTLHAAIGCAAIPLLHLELFFDHLRIERMIFDGFPALVDGELVPDRNRPGLGIELKRKEAERFREGLP